MKNILKTTFALFFAVLISTGCENFLTPSVDQAKPIDDAITSVDDLQSFIYGMHSELNNTALFGRELTVSPDVMSDNAFSNGNSGRFIDQSMFQFTSNNAGHAGGLWDNFYQIIANANIVINFDEIEGSARENHIKGQAYALRALSHFYLTLNFGQQWLSAGSDLGVPIITTYNDGNLIPARNTVTEVMAAVVSDLETAAGLMDPSFDTSTELIGYYAVKALQSRVYLYTGDFDAAITAADEVIDDAGYTLVDSANLVSTWNGGVPNAIFALGYDIADRTGNNSITRIYTATNYGDVEATADLYNAYDAADARLQLLTFTGTDEYRMTGKFVDELGQDDVPVVRYAEVLLNKAEALSRRGGASDLVEAAAIINNISSTRGSATVYATGSVTNVLAERRLELAMEGHRFFDLARHGMDIPNVTVPSRGNNFNGGDDLPYGDYRYALPIPQAEIDANSSMVQNPEY